ncbi:MAG TPA: GNAT family N-acetyltransferase [Mycobacteriales bacterium]|nr:GNAT family N-acetyltransferase [Mycobacteriales bacterium]
MDVRPFTRDDVPFAASLLAARGNAHPLTVPLDAVAEVEALLDAGHTGYVTDGGYLIGRVEDDAAWVYYAGHAATTERAYRHLYAAASRDWVAAGQHRHCVAMPEHDPVAEPAFANLAFGREHVFALAALAEQPGGEPDPRVSVARVTVDEFEQLRPLLGVVARHLSGAPVWSPRPAAYWETLPDAFREDLSSPEVTYLLARVDGEAVGFASCEPLPPRPAVPPGAFAMSHVSVVPQRRGQGVGRALTLACLARAREVGATVTWTDWRLANLCAEPYWRTYGWVPYNLRMSRRVEPGVS